MTDEYEGISVWHNPKYAELVTCLAQYRTKFWPLPQTTHHCSLWGPHAEHRCPCGIKWAS